MGINFAYERKKFSEAQQKLRKEYEAAGMTQAQILAMYEYDLHQFNRDIAFYRHTQPLVDESENDFEEEGRNTLLRKNAEALTIIQKPAENTKFWWLDEIEDAELLSGLLSLTEDDLELVDQLVFHELTQTEVAAMWKKTQASISQRIKTLRKKLKSSL